MTKKVNLEDEAGSFRVRKRYLVTVWAVFLAQLAAVVTSRQLLVKLL